MIVRLAGTLPIWLAIHHSKAFSPMLEYATKLNFCEVATNDSWILWPPKRMPIIKTSEDPTDNTSEFNDIKSSDCASTRLALPIIIYYLHISDHSLVVAMFVLGRWSIIHFRKSLSYSIGCRHMVNKSYNYTSKIPETTNSMFIGKFDATV